MNYPCLSDLASAAFLPHLAVSDGSVLHSHFRALSDSHSRSSCLSLFYLHLFVSPSPPSPVSCGDRE